MPLSFGTFGKAIAILVIVAFVLWLVFTYFIATEDVVDEEAKRLGAIELVAMIPPRPIGPLKSQAAH